MRLAWAVAALAALAVFELVGEVLGGDDDALGATMAPTGITTVLLAYWAMCEMPNGQSARVTVRALGRFVTFVSMTGLVLGYAFHSLRLQ